MHIFNHNLNIYLAVAINQHYLSFMYNILKIYIYKINNFTKIQKHFQSPPI